jgi:hypothetical protein
MTILRLLSLSGLMMTTLFFTGCGFGKGGASQTGCVTAGSALVADNFTTTLYPDLVKNCSSCHAPGQEESALPFADPNDPSGSETVAKQYVNFSSPSSSTLITSLQTLSFMCGTSCSSVTSTLTADIQAWAASQVQQNTQVCTSASTGNTEVKTSAQTLTTANLSTTTPITLTWDLSQVDASLIGVNFRAQVLGVNDESTNTLTDFYEFENPQLGTSSQAYEISDIHIYLNSVLAAYFNFSAIDFVVAPATYAPSSSSWSFPDLTSNVEQIEWGNGFTTTSDQVQFDFFINPSTATQGPVTTAH